jgi:hypothetical protein
MARDSATLPVRIGTALWAIAGLILLTQRDRLAEHDAQWWLGACAIGVVSGLGGLVYLRIRGRRAGVRFE